MGREQLRCKIEILRHLETHPCVDCGESDVLVLEFDHRADKTAGIARIANRGRFKDLEAEIQKCDVRCANCHRRKHLKGSYRELSVQFLLSELDRVGRFAKIVAKGQQLLFSDFEKEGNEWLR